MDTENKKDAADALDVRDGSVIPVWAVFWKRELYCCRATAHEARAVGFQFSDQGTIKIVPGVFTPNAADVVTAPRTPQHEGR